MINYDDLLQNTLYNDIQEEKKSIFKYTKSNESFKIPEYIQNNLKYVLRKYQEESLENYIFLNSSLNQEIILDILEKFKSKNNHHLFHMATGAGKTMIMAATIIYLYSLGYKKFIFTTNQTNLISKTKLNLLPTLNSSKCEFKQKFIEIDGKKIEIREVDNFSKFSNDIEIMFSTIHNLHNKINNEKENSINLIDIKDTKIVILADEAHHFQTQTKTELDDEKSWEDTIQAILNINQDNKLVEFTATMNLSHKNVYDKYKDKIIYDYTLKKFRKDGYSKDINLVQESNKDNRIITSILINQFRYQIALNNSIHLIPKILFKASGTIEDLEKEKEKVLNLIINLNSETLNEIFNTSNLSTIKKLKSLLETQEAKEKFISLIKNQFNENSSLIIHSKDKNKEQKLAIANNLDKNDTIRMIFAIDMLNEGWDVLSLFDIVKIDEIQKNVIKKSTTSEIQLIGRGARIFPYHYKNELNQELDRFKRKFDKQETHPLRLLEEMSFYSANDNNYINTIKEGLIDIGLIDNVNSGKTYVQVKPFNELSVFAQSLLNKFVYTNNLEQQYTKERKISDYDINIQITKDYTNNEQKLDDKFIQSTLKEINYNIKEFLEENMFVLNYVINQFSYFNMNNIMSKYNIKSKQDLVENIKELGKKISITLCGKSVDLLDFKEKKMIIKEILISLEKQLERKRNIKIGSKNFKNKFSISETFKEYNKDENNAATFDNKGINNKSLFYYDSISWDSNLEIELYKLFDKCLNSENYLVIRNEIGFKMYNPFTDSSLNNESYSIADKDIFNLNGIGFEPDFIVLKKGINENQIFQFFIEAKGEGKEINGVVTNAKIEEKWKKELLKQINNEEIIVENNVHYKIYGIPFFTINEKNDSEKEEYIKLNLIEKQ